MKIEILEKFLHEGGNFEVGEVRVVNDDTGEYFCRAGWAKDLSGVIKTGKPEKNETILMVDNSNHKNVAEEANG